MIDKIMTDNGYFHFCLKLKSWCFYRFHISVCPYCKYKNPEYLQFTERITLVKTFDGKEVLAFRNDNEAIDYVNKHYNRSLMLTDVGYVN